MSEEQTTAQTASAPNAAAAEAVAFLDAELAKAEVPEPAAKPAAKPIAEALEAPAKAEAAEAKPAEEPKPVDENRVAVVMRARVQAQKVRDEAAAQAAARRAELDAREAKLKERESAVVTRLREKPIEALRELGLDPREFFERAVEDPKQLTPEASIKAEVDALKRQLADREQREREYAEQAKVRSFETEMMTAKRQFVTEALVDKHPHLTAVYGDRPGALAEEALRIAKEYTSRTGEYASNEELATYLEQVEAERYNSLRSRLERAGSVATQPAGGNVSLTSKDTSTKTVRNKKAVSELSADEARAVAVRVLEGADP